MNFYLTFLTVFCCQCGPSRNEDEADFSNSWGIEISGGPDIAEEIASKHGFINMGQVGSLADTYHFVDPFSPSVTKRSVHLFHPKHYKLQAEGKVRYAEQQVSKRRVKRSSTYAYSVSPSANWNKMWYLHRSNGHHMNVEAVWQNNITGKGVVVSILDDGIEHTHPDLRRNYDPMASYDLNGRDSDPFPRYDPTNENKHGTRCAGEVAAAWSGKCCVGTAFNARIGGVRMLDGEVNDVVESSALSLQPQYISIYSSSWGPTDDGKTVDGPGKLTVKALVNGTTFGRSGLGSIYVWAAGNGGRYHDSCNCDGYAISPLTVSIGSASERDNRPWYLEKCTSTLASTYSSGNAGEKQVITTDLHGMCTDIHTGTSASAPLAAGILALAIEANPLLSWRDVQYLLVYTSNPSFPKDDHWQVNGAGLKVSHWYGFGIIDGEALVNRARHWVSVPERKNCTINVTANLDIREPAVGDKSLVIKMHVEECKLSYVEHVKAVTSFRVLEGMRMGASVLLASPAGTESLLLPFRPRDKTKDGFDLWPFMTVHSWGETPNGVWIFSVAVKRGTRVKLDALELVLFGTESIPASVRAIPSVCHPQCLKGCAQAGARFCDSCKHFRVALSWECVEKCPSMTYRNGNVCHSCSPLCEECSNGISCHRCSPNSSLSNSGVCSSSCRVGTFSLENRQNCSACHPSCLSCSGPVSTDCTSCQSPFLLLNQTCILQKPTLCSSGKYFDHRFQGCRSCHETCATCTGRSRNQCSSCNKDRVFDSNSECVDLHQINGTDPGHYFDSSTSECVDCLESCRNCSENGTCLCADGYFPTLDRNCCENCPENAVVDAVSCQACHSQCYTCSGPSEHHCLSCHLDVFFYEHKCLKTCPNGTFGKLNRCLDCIENCIECTTNVSCEQCENNGYSFPSVPPKCVKNCPPSYFPSKEKNKCEKCLKNCRDCRGPLDCHFCEERYAYYAPDRSCREKCPGGYYRLEGKCISCQPPCDTCYASSNCSSCVAGMALDEETRTCRKCCSKDSTVDNCCDCNHKELFCVHFNASSTLLRTTSTSSKLIQLVAAAVVIMLVVTLIVIAVTKCWLGHSRSFQSHGAVYQVVSNEEGLLDVFDQSGTD